MIKNIFLNKRKKGQIGAPFEVLVAVIIMGFVILAGTYALRNLSQNTCLGNKRQDLSEFKESLRDVVLGSDLTFRNLNFQTKHCFNQKYETIKLKTYQNPTKCAAYCGGGNTCLLLEYLYDDGNTRKYPIPPICMELPSTVDFSTDQECITDADIDNWQAIDPLAENLKSGKYKIFKSSAGGNKICFLKKV